MQAAAVLDVKSWANRSFVGDMDLCKSALSEFISKYSIARNKPDGFAVAAEAQMFAFFNMQGHFGVQAVINKAKVLPAHVFLRHSAQLLLSFPRSQSI